MKKRASKVGSLIKVKAYSRRVGKLPGRGKAGRFTRTIKRGGRGGGSQGKLF